MAYGGRKDALQIVDLPAHIAVLLTKQYYIPLANVNWAGCYEQTIVLCKVLPYMKKVSDNTCVAALPHNDQTGIAKLCQLDYLLNPHFGEMAIYLDGGDVLVVSTDSERQLIYGNLLPVPKRIENYAGIQIGSDCAFQTKGDTLLSACLRCMGRGVSG